MLGMQGFFGYQHVGIRPAIRAELVGLTELAELAEQAELAELEEVIDH